MATCYDYYLCNEVKQQHMCVGCCNYNGLVLKKKAQRRMGQRFQCRGLLVEIEKALPSSSINAIPSSSSSSVNVDDQCNISDQSSTTSVHSESILEVVSPPRKSVCASPRRCGELMSPRRYSRRHRHKPDLLVPSPLRTRKNRSSDELIRTVTVQSERVLQLEEELRIANEAIDDLQKRLRKATNHCHRLKNPRKGSNPYRNTCSLLSSWKKTNQSLDTVANGIVKAISEKRFIRDHFCNSVLTYEDSFVEIKKHYENKIYQELKYKFRPWVCLQQIDMNPTVSFRSYDIIRRIEFANDNNEKYRRGLFASRHKLGRLCRQLETFGQNILPYQIFSNSVKFNVERAVQFLLERHGLWQAVLSEERVLLAATVDGGELSWNLSHVSAGVKIVDPNAKDPVSNELLFGESGHDRVQSKFHCYPLHIIIAKDNKQLYQSHLSDFFRDVNTFEEQHPGLDVVQEADMCSLIKTLGKGGAMKVKKFACYCCNVHRDDLVKPLDPPCNDCVRLNRTHRPCYHTPICDEALLERLREERDELVSHWGHLQQFEAFQTLSRLRFGNTDLSVNSSISDPFHIEYQPQSRQDRILFRNLLDAEARLRGFNEWNNLNVAELKLQLHEVLMIEKKYELLTHILAASNLDEAMIRLEQALPCLLHLENRTSETLIEHLLRRGLSLREGDRRRTTEFIQSVEDIMNQSIFGSVGCSSNWKFPLSDDGTMGKVKLANWRARRVIEEIVDIVHVCIPGNDGQPEQEKWLSTFAAYRGTIQSLQRKDDFSQDDIDNFQCTADDFFQQWIDLTGYDGVTNYIHMIGAGHIRYFLSRWGNLNRFQNQGWEAYNAMLAAFWHHRTQKGGGKHAVNRSKILPIARWILRIMLWRTGEAQRFFQQMDTDYSSDSSFAEKDLDANDYDSTSSDAVDDSTVDYESSSDEQY
jgi:uncharacterized protein CbrC (UPF0167 family)